MRVLHLTKHYRNPGEEWLRNLVRFTSGEATVGSLLVLPAGRADGVDLRQLPRPTRNDRQVPAPTAPERAWVGGFDVVHAHFMDLAWTLLPWLEAARSVVVSVYGYDLAALPCDQPEWLDRYQEVLALGPAFVVQGPSGVSRVAAWGAVERVHVVPLGVPSGQIVDRPMSVGGPVLRLLQTAHYREKKGHLDTVEAFESAFGRSGRASLTLVGDQPMSRATTYPAVSERIRRAGLASVVSMVGSVTHREFLSLLDRHDVYVQPSTCTASGDVEGGPVALLDAQSRGRPVLATHHENIPMLVDHGRSGLLTPESDPKRLAESMIAMAALEERATAEFAAGALEAARRHTCEAMGEALRHVYEEAEW